MRQITAKYTCKCKETNITINAGDVCLYDPIKKAVYYKLSNMYKNHIEAINTANYIQDNENQYFDNFCQNNNI